ncbi:uncharacterized protein DUF4239 [Humitalea rosea]|uniref:Uncharacterized protein DUF4239 n=1 Tax=Humitalea rosea TaxID=990373 RepID=A0A2W7INW4_9PROT|nr:DUF4239 domain-containing protein [Humitalea rosea]PZW49204.1 uncharacterized protein DUF4239 [Humitalea rosea]
MFPNAFAPGHATPVLNLLYALPSGVVYALFTIGTAGLAALACRFLSPLVRSRGLPGQLDVALRTTGSVMAALTLTLAFCAVQARTQADDASRLVHAEVSAVAGLARLAERLGEPGLAIRAELAAYLHSIITVEFPAMAERGADPATRRLADVLEEAVYAAATTAPPSLATDLLQQVDGLDSAREDRLHAARLGLPRQFWILIGLLVLLLVATGPLYEPQRHVMVMLAIQAAGIGALIGFVFLMDQPFRGQIAISSAPYESLTHILIHRIAVAR